MNTIIKIIVLISLISIISCTGQSPSMMNMMIEQSGIQYDVGATFGDYITKKRLSEDTLLIENRYKMNGGYYLDNGKQNDQPSFRFGCQLGFSGLSIQSGVKGENFGLMGWINVYDRGLLGGFSLLEMKKISQNIKLGSFQYYSRNTVPYKDAWGFGLSSIGERAYNEFGVGGAVMAVGTNMDIGLEYKIGNDFEQNLYRHYITLVVGFI